MKKEQFDSMFKELMRQAAKRMAARAETVIKSGALDIEGCPPDSYDLPRTVIIDCLLDAAAGQKHYLGRDHLRDLRNLQHF